MAGYICELDDQQRPAVFLQTNLVSGATIAVCAECVPVALIGALSSELGVDGDRLYDAVRRFVDRESKRQGDTAAAETAPDGEQDQAAGEPAEAPA